MDPISTGLLVTRAISLALEALENRGLLDSSAEEIQDIAKRARMSQDIADEVTAKIVSNEEEILNENS